MQDKHNNPSDRNIQGGCEPCDIRQSGGNNASTAGIETSRSAKPKKPAGRSKVFWALASVVLAALIFTVIGAGVPLVVYCVVGKQTIVERLRETE